MRDLGCALRVRQVVLADARSPRMADQIDLVEAGARADRVNEFVQRLGSAARPHRVVVVDVDPGRRIAVALEELGGPFVLFARAGKPVDEDDRAKRFVGPPIDVATPAQRFIGRHGPGTDGNRRQADNACDRLPQADVMVRLRYVPLDRVSPHHVSTRHVSPHTFPSPFRWRPHPRPGKRRFVGRRSLRIPVSIDARQQDCGRSPTLQTVCLLYPARQATPAAICSAMVTCGQLLSARPPQ